MEQGADVIECDVSITKDKKLVCLHENNLKHSTNVESLPEFADRKTSYNISHEFYDVLRYVLIEDDWFAVDFTLSELKLLRKVQGNGLRDPSFDGQFQITTLEEMIEIVQNASRIIGLHLETKSPRWLNSLPFMSGATVEELLVEVLDRYGYRSKHDPCFLQSFEEDSLYRLKNLTYLPLVRLFDSEQVDTSNTRLADWAKSFYGIGPWKDLIRPFWNAERGYKNNLGEATDLVERAHQHGLLVHTYTFRNEDKYLAWDFQQDPINEIEMFINLGVDGMFTDFTSTMKRHIDAKYEEQECVSGSGLSRFSAYLLFCLLVLGYTIMKF